MFKETIQYSGSNIKYNFFFKILIFLKIQICFKIPNFFQVFRKYHGKHRALQPVLYKIHTPGFTSQDGRRGRELESFSICPLDKQLSYTSIKPLSENTYFIFFRSSQNPLPTEEYMYSCKGSDRQCMVVEQRLQYYWDFFRIHLRPIRCFYLVCLLSKNANAVFKINPHRLSIFKSWFWETVLLKVFNDDCEKCYKNSISKLISCLGTKLYSKLISCLGTKLYSKLISCLGTGWENKNWLLSSKIGNLIQVLVSVMSQNVWYSSNES